MVIDYIFIGGENRPIKFGNAAIRKFCAKYNLTLQQYKQSLIDMENNTNLTMMWDLYYHGFNDGARQAKRPFPYTLDEICDWFDDAPSGIFEDILKIYKKHQGIKTESPTDTEKKPQPQKAAKKKP